MGPRAVTLVTVHLRKLRALATGVSLRRHATLTGGISGLGFVQYDPIRCPARAQDLILFQRVLGYRSGDLDRHYRDSKLEEDRLYAYGVMQASQAALLHPRPDRHGSDRPYRPEGLPADVLAFVRQRGLTQPKDVVAAFGPERAVNDWGGVSAATTRALEELHYHGLLRVAGRSNGVKIYGPSSPASSGLSARDRLRALTLVMARLLAPVSEWGLRRAISQLCAASGGLEGRRTVIADLVSSGELEARDVDGVRYFWHPGLLEDDVGLSREVRFLAPFDPVVWDRRRFEHVWGWAYGFEAYTPKHRRKYGYYALPMFWGDRSVGWVNLALNGARRLELESGFVEPPVHGKAFQRAFDLEVGRFETMLASRGADEVGAPRT
jgi:hypothetical protein